jgi:hypothetical protein
MDYFNILSWLISLVYELMRMSLVNEISAFSGQL